MEEDSRMEKLDDWFFDNVKWLYRLVQSVGSFFPDTYREIKWFLQRVFRKDHYSNNELWNLDSTFALYILPRLKAFRENGVAGTPMSFVEWEDHESSGMTKKVFDKAVEEGKLDGGGHEAWVKVIDEMLFAFEYMVHYEEMDRKGNFTKGHKAFMKKYNLIDPHAETEEFKRVTYCYNRDDCHVWDDEKPEEGVEYTEKVYYYNSEAMRVMAEKCHDGLELFGKHMQSLWD